MRSAIVLIAFLAFAYSSPIADPSSGAASPDEATIDKRAAATCVKIDLPTFRKEALAAHNKYRAMHNVTAMTSDPTIDAVAQAYAEKMVETKGLTHSGNKAYGENLYCMSASSVISSAKGCDAADSWYAEIDFYDFATGTQKTGLESKMIGHFTQVVWDDSTKLGTGVAVTKDCRFLLVVSNYAKPGNFAMNQTQQQAKIQHVKKPVVSAG